MLEVTKDNFETEVIKADKPVLIDVWGPSCQPCLALMPKVEELEKKYAEHIKFLKLNSAQNRRLCIDLRVIGLPSFLLFKDGKEIDRIGGQDVDIEAIESFITKHLS